MKKLAFLIVFISLFGYNTVYSQNKYLPTWESIDSRPIPAWFENAKFGIFIHWGLYSVPAWAPVTENVYSNYSEWYWSRLNDKGDVADAFRKFHKEHYGNKTYQDFVERFNAQMFNADQWADLFNRAGAKYVVLTSKHHDGYAMWPSEHSWNWNSMDTGPHRDLCGELTQAVRKQGMRMGFYYSLLEWYNPLYHEDITKYIDQHMFPQMKDLTNRYKPDIFWPDGEWDYTSDKLRSPEFLAWLYNESPVKSEVVVNDRWGKETRGINGSFFTTEYDLVHNDNSKDATFDHPWEECRGISGSFGYNRNETLEIYSSSKSLIHLLVEKVAKGGNLLLNVGPTADGRIPVIMQQRLVDMGDWLKINGEAIYETRKWENAPATENHFFTTKGNDLYLILTEWISKPITIDNISGANEVSLLGFTGNVQYSKSGKKITITPPTINPSNQPCEHAWVFRIEGGVK